MRSKWRRACGHRRLVFGEFQSISAIAQEPAPPTPAGSAGQLPPVEIIQRRKPTPAPAAKQKSAAKKKAVKSRLRRRSLRGEKPVTTGQRRAVLWGPRRRCSSGACRQQRAVLSDQSVERLGILPDISTGFPSAGSIVTTEQIEEFRPRTVHDVFNRVPGVQRRQRRRLRPSRRHRHPRLAAAARPQGSHPGRRAYPPR